MKIGIIGYGWVGKAQHRLFPDAVIHDPEAGFDNAGSINECDIAFVCVPTPSLAEGRLDTSIVESVIRWCGADLIVIRSTLNPGDADRFASTSGMPIAVQPEYLGETVEHPMTDQHKRPFIILGGEPADRRKVIEAYTKAYNANVTIRQVTCLEAEIIKLSENRAIAFKVAQCQELYDACEKAGVDYYTVRDAVYGDDPRFNLWWTFIYPEERGFNSKCIPKDVYAWCAWAESVGCDPVITKKLLAKNKEWIS